MRKRGPKSAEEIYRELAAVVVLLRRSGAKITGPVMRFTFPDGSVERIPLALLERIRASQRLRLAGMEGGKFGGRPAKVPGPDDLFLLFSEHWVRSGHRYALARRSFALELQRKYGRGARQVRRLIAAALGPSKEKRT